MENFRLIFLLIFSFNFLYTVEYSFNGGIIKSEEFLVAEEVQFIEDTYFEAKKIVENLFEKELKKERIEIIFFASTKEFTEKFGVNYRVGGIFSGNNIYFQPFKVLKSKTDLKKIFLHEFLHFWLDKAIDLPDFLAEGIALYYSELIVKKSNLIFPEDIEKVKEKYNEKYLFSAKEFVNYLINQKLLKVVLADNSYIELYRKFYFENSQKIRVLINPRKEKELYLKIYSGYARVITKEGVFDIKKPEFAIFMNNGKFFLSGKEVISIYFYTERFSLNNKEYRGSLILTNELAINILPVEYYIYSVISSEMPPLQIEAMKVQAVLSRTLAYYFIKTRKNELYDVNSLTDSQNYRGMSEENYQSKNVVSETQGEIITFAGMIIPVYFSSTCGGKTANSEDVWNDSLPFYRGVKCVYKDETNCSVSPHFKEWERFLTNEFLYSIGITNLGFVYSEERIKNVAIDGKIESFDFFKAKISKHLGWNFLKSNLFVVEKRENGYLIKGRGLGHGVGVCQYGAIGLAMKGKKYKDIIKFYLSGVEIEEFTNQNLWEF
ncbi:MAG: SpoIID/LytB domain-containing protein [Brevinematales bacterium]|nr:SpoIID/LytB domain-containing protein [Brevinematales bacterium]